MTATWMMLHLLVANMISKRKIGAGSYLHCIRFIVEGKELFVILWYSLKLLPNIKLTEAFSDF
jgi:hypothetical protein